MERGVAMLKKTQKMENKYIFSLNVRYKNKDYDNTVNLSCTFE